MRWSSSPTLRSTPCVAAALALVFGAPSVLAQPAGPSALDRTHGEALFRQARDLMTADNVAEACPKFAESYELDPAPGTLLNLAVCHEKEGKLATAWREFQDVEAIAKKDGRSDREAYAHKKAEALAAQLSYLRVALNVTVLATPGLEVRLDGSPWRRDTWGRLPVDPGEHLVEVSAPEHKTFALRLTVPKGPAEQSVDVPKLEALAKAEPLPPPPAEQPPPRAEPPVLPAEPPASHAESSGQTQRGAGYGVLGAGVVGLGLGAIYGLRAVSFKGDRDRECDVTGCSDLGVQAHEDAKVSAAVSTVSFIASGVLLAGGAVLVLTAPTAERNARLRVSPLAGGAFLNTEVSW